MNVLLWIGIILIILWLLGFTVFPIGGALIHILLIVAIVLIILYFVRGRAPRV